MPLAVLTRITSLSEFADFAMRGHLANKEYINLGAAPLLLRQICGADETAAMRLSAETILQHCNKHKEATPALYAALCPLICAEAEWIIWKDSILGDTILPNGQKIRIAAFIEYQGKIWKAGIKKTERGDFYLTTLFRSFAKKRQSHRNRALIIFNEKKEKVQ